MPKLSQQDFEDYLLDAIQQNASDIHITPGRRPTLRIDGILVPLLKRPPMSSDMTEEFAKHLMSDEQWEVFRKTKEIDLSFSFADKARFRVNVFVQKGYISVAMRAIPSKIKTLEELNLPQVLRQFIHTSQGFFLMTGPSGHGKSTTLAAFIDEINHTRAEHMVTIEDPIEYLFTPDKCIIDQREVGRDTESFTVALRSAFRQDPDVIMVGEMRDPETISTAITAAETGHLVLSTLHTNSASQTIDRIIDSFPSGQQNQIRVQLAGTLLGVVSQRLVPRTDGGIVPAVEIMVVNSAIRNLIRENKTHQIDLVIETSADDGMVTLNRYLAGLIKKGEISVDTAENYSYNPRELKLLLGK
jgi:twitching motility protein PilT